MGAKLQQFIEKGVFDTVWGMALKCFSGDKPPDPFYVSANFTHRSALQF